MPRPIPPQRESNRQEISGGLHQTVFRPRIFPSLQVRRHFEHCLHLYDVWYRVAYSFSVCYDVIDVALYCGKVYAVLWVLIATGV